MTIPTLRSLRLYDAQLSPYLDAFQMAGSDGDYRMVKRGFRSGLQKILKKVLKVTEGKSRVNVDDVARAITRGGGDPWLNPGWCDQNPSQCQDSFTNCTGGGPEINSGWCDANPTQCMDTQNGGAIMDSVSFQKITRRAMNSLQDVNDPKTISADAYRVIQNYLENSMRQTV